jgi:transglutaminase-like putative cysteine protease
MKNLFKILLTITIVFSVSITNTYGVSDTSEKPFYISGIVIDSNSEPIENVSVTASGFRAQNSINKPSMIFCDKTNSNGEFTLGIPSMPYPTSIINARKPSYYPITMGKYGGASGESIYIEIMLEPIGEEPNYKASSIDVKMFYANIIETGENKPTELPVFATRDINTYPNRVLTYLESGKNIELTEKVRLIAEEIIDTVGEKENAVVVAKAVYDWVCSNIEYSTRDFDENTIRKGQYEREYRSFGTDFYDWCQTPEETIDYPWVICIEFERLTTALLRCLDIPARPAPLKAHPVTQFWVQPNDGDGFWANMETSRGRNAWVEGDESAHFPSVHDGNIAFVPVDENAPMHALWDIGSECNWREQSGQNFRLPINEQSVNIVGIASESFRKTGMLPQAPRNEKIGLEEETLETAFVDTRPMTPNPSPIEINDYIELYWRGFTVDLSKATDTKPIFRFPHFLNNEYRVVLDISHYTNHPEAVIKVWNETDECEDTGLSQEWYCIQFNLELIEPDAFELMSLPIETFDIVGVVSDEDGDPIEDATMWLENGLDQNDPRFRDLHIQTLTAVTNSDGEFILKDIPQRSPRYMVGAIADGYFKTIQGRIGEENNDIQIILRKYSEDECFRNQRVRVKMAYLLKETMSPLPKELPDYAIADNSKFPESVLPYLEEGEGYEITDTVKMIGDEILESIENDERDNLVTLANAVYNWIISNIEYDLTSIYPSDITCGNYQTTFGGFGVDFDNWCYSPQEAVEQGRTICIEFERLATALCRYLGVPARSTPLKAHPVTQFWVQESEDDEGYWANMETSKGRTEHKKGNLSAGFPSRNDSMIAIIPHNSDAPIHMDWDFGAECWWLEDYGGSIKLSGNPEKDMDKWQEILDVFEQTGELPTETRPPRRLEDGHDNSIDEIAPTNTIPGPNDRDITSPYSIYSRGFEVDMCNATDLHPVIRFPHFVENQWREQLDMRPYVSIPGIIEDEWEETEEDEETGLSQTWYCIRLDLTKVEQFPKQDTAVENILTNPGFEEGDIGWRPMFPPKGDKKNRPSIDELVSHSGNKSARLQSDNEGVCAWNQLIVDLPIPSKIIVKGYVKTEDVVGNVIIDLRINENGEKSVPPFPSCQPNLRGSNDWTMVSGEFDIHENADSVIIGCTMLGKGTVWFDDIEVIVIGGDNVNSAKNFTEVWVTNPTSGIDLCTHIHKPSSEIPSDGYPVVLLVPGGSGHGTQFDYSPLVSQITDEGFVVVVFDPEGRGRTKGNDDESGVIHQDGMHAVLKYIANLDYIDMDNIGVVSFSFGLIMSGCTLGRYPLDPPVKFYIDREGPDGSLCDYSGKHGQSLSIDEDFWEPREAYLFIEDYMGNYVRIQSEKDHVQKTNDHAYRMIEHSTSTEYGGKGKCNWTRMNCDEGDCANPPNTVFSKDNPPNWADEKEERSNELIIEIIKEMIQMPNPYKHEENTDSNDLPALNLSFVFP